VAGQGPALLPAKGRLFVHLIPLSTFGLVAPIDLERAFEGWMRFRPMPLSDVTPRYNLDGFINLGFVSDDSMAIRRYFARASWKQRTVISYPSDTG
jgi:hypothetical protein